MDTTSLQSLIAPCSDLSLDLSIPDYPVLAVSNEFCEAKVALHGAHLYEWTPTGQQPVIYTSPTAIYREGKAIRGGVPVCWPWFNAHPTDSSLPSHGIGRNRFWNLLAVESHPTQGAIITLSLNANAETKAIWPFEFEATVKITLGSEAKIELTTTNPSEQKLTIGGALHTYLHVSDAQKVTITGLEGAEYLDTVGEHTKREQAGSIKIEGEVDRIYYGTTGEITIKDTNRNITVSREGSECAVVWNPWIEKAKGLGDLPDEAYSDFVCIEAANALHDLHELSAGESHTLSTTIKIG